MDPALALLDRELLLTGLVHELRGPITAVQGFAELENTPRPGLEAAIARLAALVDTLAEPHVTPATTVIFRGVAVRCKGPLEVLERALACLEHRAAALEVHDDHVVLSVQGVPAEEQSAGWSLRDVRRWLAEGGPGFAGARLRVAARIVGALRYSFVLMEGERACAVYIHLPRG